MIDSTDKTQGSVEFDELRNPEEAEIKENTIVARYPLANIKETITKQELSQYPSEGYDGRIIVVQSESEAKKAAAYLLDIGREDVLGFDTETRPSYKKGEIHLISLVQICTASECFLFRTVDPKIWEYLKPILEDENILKIGLSLKDDFRGMQRATRKELSIEPKNFIDLQSYTKQFGIRDCGLSRIYANLFRKKISKKMRLTNWEASFLNNEQKRYAALDAFATRRIYIELEKRKQEECQS